MTRAAVYPGTFDPITNGHVDLLRRAASLFDRLIVAIASNPQKAPLFSAEERLAMAAEVLEATENVEVCVFDELLINFARRKGCPTIVRGLRAVSDFEFELQVALTNRKMGPELETVFLMPSEQYIYLSSSIVKEIASYGGPVGDFVPPPVVRQLENKFPGAGAKGER